MQSRGRFLRVFLGFSLWSLSWFWFNPRDVVSKYSPFNHPVSPGELDYSVNNYIIVGWDPTAQLFFMTWHTLARQVVVHSVLLLFSNLYNSLVFHPFPFWLLPTLFIHIYIHNIFCIHHIPLLLFMSQTSSTKSFLLKTAPHSSFSASLFFSGSTLPNSPPSTHHHLSIFFLSPHSQTTPPFLFVRKGGGRG